MTTQTMSIELMKVSLIASSSGLSSKLEDVEFLSSSIRFSCPYHQNQDRHQPYYAVYYHQCLYLEDGWDGCSNCL